MVSIEEVITERTLQPEDAYVNVLICEVDAKVTGKALELLCDSLPLTRLGLDHLKRARKCYSNLSRVQVILCQASYDATFVNHSIAELQLRCGESVVISTISVPAFPPVTEKEFTEMNSRWPVTFHAGENDRLRRKGFEKAETDIIAANYHLLLQLLTSTDNRTLAYFYGGIMYSPILNMVICTAQQAIDYLISSHGEAALLDDPLLNPTMLCIDYTGFMAKELVPDKGTRSQNSFFSSVTYTLYRETS